MFWTVKTKDGKAGFVSVLLVKYAADGGTDLAKAIKGLTKEGRGNSDGNETRQRSAVMGVRGLTDDDKLSEASTVKPNLRAVYQMEDQSVTAKKLQKLGQNIFKEIAEKSGID